MDSVVHECESLTQQDIDFLHTVEGRMGILADLSRADVLLYCRLQGDSAVVVSQARPHSILPLYGESMVRRRVTPQEEPAVFQALADGRHGLQEIQRTSQPSAPGQGALVVQETHPVQRPGGGVVAAVSVETNLIERERHRRRNKVFQKTLRQFQEAVLHGGLPGIDGLSPFAEHDGIVVVDAQHRIQYVSGIATSLYRKLGYTGDLLKWHFEDLELDDNAVVHEAFDKGECLEREIAL